MRGSVPSNNVPGSEAGIHRERCRASELAHGYDLGNRCTMSLRPTMRAARTALFAAAVIVTPLDAQRSGTGSDVPCAVPMTWSIARVDSRFDLSSDVALQAVRDAATLWERSVGADLFEIAARGGSPIFFEFDERQAIVAARRGREGALASERIDIERRRTELEEASRVHEALLEQYQRDMEGHRRVVQAYNDDVVRWSRQSDMPPTVEAELERRRSEIDRTAGDLQNRQRELNRRSEAMRDEVDAFNERIRSLSDRETSLARDFPAAASESGTYDETVVWEGTRAISVSRRIQVFQFSSYDDLVLVLSHELGHALGLGHAPGRGSIMSEIFTSGMDVVPTGGVTPLDRRMLASRCPGLTN